MLNQDIIEHEPKVFNFSRHWAKKCKPHLFNENVVNALDSGMHEVEDYYIMECEKRGDPTDRSPRWDNIKEPWRMSGFELRRPKPHSLNWYRPFGLCWGIAPFCMELGRCIYPELNWKIIMGDEHTVAVGFKDEKLYIIFDILNFDTMSAREILDFVGYIRKWDYRMAEAA